MKVKNGRLLLPPSDKRINEFEEYCRVTLPDDFKEFIKEYNGAEPEQNTFFDGKDERLVERFLCMLDDYKNDEKNGWYDIEVVLSQIDCRLIEDQDLIGYNVIPFAALFAGDFVCMDFRTSNLPSIVIWYHEESDDFSPVFVRIANGFTEFLKMLKQ